ncbi:MAG: aminopeptidase, partial [Acidobacteriota bacterium]|nr:aminopeptidase [Acidobacteriota bacterium]
LNRNATTEDLRAALERASGRSLHEFFTRWIYASGHPRYEAAWSWSEGARERRGGVLTLTLRQTQEGDDGGTHFPNHFPVEIVAGANTRRFTLTPHGRESVTRVNLPARPSEVRFDPDETILKELIVRP